MTTTPRPCEHGSGPGICMNDAAAGSDYCPAHDPDRLDFDEDLAHDIRMEDAL